MEREDKICKLRGAVIFVIVPQRYEVLGCGLGVEAQSFLDFFSRFVGAIR